MHAGCMGYAGWPIGGRVVHASDGRGLEGLQLLGGATAAEVFEALDADGSGFVDEEELVVGERGHRPAVLQAR